jgi:hypothetical protein
MSGYVGSFANSADPKGYVLQFFQAGGYAASGLIPLPVNPLITGGEGTEESPWVYESQSATDAAAASMAEDIFDLFTARTSTGITFTGWKLIRTVEDEVVATGS